LYKKTARSRAAFLGYRRFLVFLALLRFALFFALRAFFFAIIFAHI
jgi:hypothetical protein